MGTIHKYRVLILTEHRIHSPVESIYSIARGMTAHKACADVHVVSRGVVANQAFFQNPGPGLLTATEVDEHFVHSVTGAAYERNLLQVDPQDYDVVMLRMPRVNSMDFFARITEVIPAERLINQPQGIIETGDKKFLLNFPELCAPMRYVDTVAQVEDFKALFPIVLKPLNNSGGKGLLRIEGEVVMEGLESFTWQDYLPKLKAEVDKGYLAMKFLTNVGQGDKRIIVVNGEIVAASLRIPPADSWLCNVSLGAVSEFSEPDENEIKIAERVVPELKKRGVVIFGFDTLMGDDGKRILSELNTSCVNGIYPAELHSGQPITRRTANLLWDYILENIDVKT